MNRDSFPKESDYPNEALPWSENDPVAVRPIPQQYSTWPFIPRHIRSLIYRKAQRRRLNEPGSNSTDGNSNFTPSELIPRIKRNVLSRLKPRPPDSLDTFSSFSRIMSASSRIASGSNLNNWDLADGQYSMNSSIPDGRWDVKDDFQNGDAHKKDDIKTGFVPDVCTLPTENKPSQEDFPSSPASTPCSLSLQVTLSSPCSGSAQCFTACRAFDHATSKMIELRDTLTRSHFEGSYLVQAGFNWEMLGSNQGLLQEIYLFLEYDIHLSNVERVATTFKPFPVIIYTPSTTYHYPPSQDNDDIWDLWRLRGIFCSDIRGQKVANGSAPVDADGGSVKSTSGSAGSSNTDDDTDEEPRRNYHRKSNNGDGKGSSGGDEGDGDDDDGTIDDRPGPAPKNYRDACGTHEISIPFSSTLTMSGENHQRSTRYKTNASVDITIEGNSESQSRPPSLNWGGPWIEARFSLLDAEIHVIPKGKSMYHLGLSQIRITASDCDASILSYSPTILRADGDTLSSATGKNNSMGLKMTIGAAPTLQLGGTTTQASGEERSQKRWEVVAHCLNSDRDESTGKSQTTMMWKYAHNDRYYTPETRNVFEPRPSTIVGISRQSSTMPKLEIEVVTDYSWSTPVQRFRDWIAAARMKPRRVFPAFTNFLHQVSVTLDLTEVTERTEWVVGLNAEDQKSMLDIGKMSRPMLKQLESNAGVSACTIRLMRALHGHIYLTEEQKKEYKTDPHSLLTTTWNSETDETLASDSLPTPSPSPSPTWPSSVLVDTKSTAEATMYPASS